MDQGSTPGVLWFQRPADVMGRVSVPAWLHSACLPFFAVSIVQEASEDLRSGLPEEVASCSLTLGPALAPEAFEKLWLELETFQTVSLPCSEPSSQPETLQAALQLVQIQALAFSRPGSDPWKAYLYAHGSETIILAELLCGPGSDEDRLRVTVKQEPRDEKVLRGFLSVLETVLQTLGNDGT